jgi:hypothetical protein
MAVGVTEGGLTVSTSADARKRHVNHQSGLLAPLAGSHPTLRWAQGHYQYPKTGVPLTTV